MNGIQQIKYDREHFEERFEYYVGCFASKESILTAFQYAPKEMDDVCMEHFGMDFHKAYGYFWNGVINECKQVTSELAKQGNGAALKIANENIWKTAEAENRKAMTVAVVFDKLED